MISYRLASKDIFYEFSNMETIRSAKYVKEFLNPEPILESNQDPLKNAFCPYYEECLDLAIEEKWPQFTCRFCACNKFHLEMKPNAWEIKGYYRLLNKIFS